MTISTSKAMIASFFLFTLVLQLGQAFLEPRSAVNHTISTPPRGKLDCGSACLARCSLSSRPNLCQRACGSCCKRCNCVPPGTSGNYDTCACYASLTTRGNRRKCP